VILLLAALPPSRDRASARHADPTLLFRLRRGRAGALRAKAEAGRRLKTLRSNAP